MKIDIDKIDDLDDGSSVIKFSADLETIKALAGFGFKQSIINAVNDVKHTHMTLQQKYDLTTKALENILDYHGDDMHEMRQIAAVTLDKVEPIEGAKDD